MKKILIVTAFPPNRMTAGQNYTRQLINDLSKKFEVHVISFSYKNHKAEIDLKRIQYEEFTLDTFKKLFNSIMKPFVHPFFSSRFKPDVLKKIRKIAAYSDMIYFDFSQVFIYSLFLNHPTKYFMAHDIIIQKYERYKNPLLRFQSYFIGKSELGLLKSANQVICFSDKDKLLIKERYNIESQVVDFYPEPLFQLNESAYNPEKRLFCFFGAWNRTENSRGLLWFIEEVIPLLNEDIHIRIIGQGITENLRKNIEKNNRLQYLGFRDDASQLIYESNALIAPIFEGAGVKMKVLDSLCTGTPVIGTDVAFEGIRGMDKALHKSSSKNEFANVINNFKPWSIEEKHEFRQYFNKNYASRKFKKLIDPTKDCI